MKHDDYPDSYVRMILESVRSIAVVGTSARPERPSHYVMRYLLERGYDCVPVNPGQAGRTILGRMVYASLADLPTPVDMLDVFRNSAAVGGLVEEVLALPWKPKAIWMQIGIRHDPAAARAEEAGIAVVMDRCPKIEIPRLFGRMARV
ncbi:MAG TPA: CoA-binding protein [Propylenella sp.]|nr:CoA-binding protein [Propylenella sp.]